MFRITKIFTILFTYCLVAIVAFDSVAQNAKADEQKLKKITQEYAKAYANITKSKDKSSVLKFLAPNFQSTSILSKVSGQVKVISQGYEEFSSYLEHVMREDDLVVKYDVKEILHNAIKGNTGVVVYVVDYEFQKEGTTWSKGSETVTLTFQKNGNDWKIIHFSFVGMEDEKNKGACLCELFVANTGDYVAKTTVPTGKNYQTILSNFVFSTKGEYTSVKIDGKYFKWKNTGEVLWENAPSSSEDGAVKDKQVGVASNKDEVVIVIVKNVLYEENCASFKVKKN
ncbi:hypothetical protein AAG747_03945 [Rapidithrix thailandica]|uniref:SnoaL-like domain-containing protein n=1 Tax=Rapidithrix thailandica TaxID=413964 RepID=A0AAW9RZQ5_9BACT